MGKLIFFLITVLFISIATKLYKGQWSWFIPEYNMLPEDKKKEYKRRRFVYVRIYSGTLHLRDVIRISEKEKIKITEMCVPTNGELYSSDVRKRRDASGRCSDAYDPGEVSSSARQKI